MASESGVDTIGSIATRVSLPVDVVRDVVRAHVGTTINATLDSAGELRSAASLARAAAAARGALHAVATPTPLSGLAAKLEVPLPVIADTAADMLRDGTIAGHVDGRATRAVFTPRVFSDAASQLALSSFASNGFVTRENLQRMCVLDVDVFAAESLSGAIALDRCIVGPTLLETFEGSAAEAMANNAWLDIVASFPPDFPPSDIPAVVARIAGSTSDKVAKEAGKKAGRMKRKPKSAVATDVNSAMSDVSAAISVLGQRFVVAPKLTGQCTEIIQRDATKQATARAKLLAEQLSVVGVSGTTVVSTPKTLDDTDNAAGDADGKKGKAKGRRRAGAKEKGGAKATGASGVGGATRNGVVAASSPVSVPDMEAAVEILLADENLAASLEADHLGTVGAEEDMLQCVIEDVMGGEDGLAVIYEKAAADAVVGLEREQAAAKQASEKALIATLEEAELYNRSSSSLPSSELIAAGKTLILDTVCTDLVVRALDSTAQNVGVTGSSLRELDMVEKSQKLEAVRAILTRLPPSVASKVRALVATVGNKSSGGVDEVLLAYDECATDLDLPERRPLDKKREKAAFASARADLAISLENDTGLTSAKALETAVILLHARGSGGAIARVPAESVLPFCQAVEGASKPEEAGAALGALRKTIMDEMRKRDSGDAAPSFSDEARERLNAVREFTG